ncbi:MAG: hypothetical protein ACTHQ3_14345 [Motilibacteraceae bacterium]
MTALLDGADEMWHSTAVRSREAVDLQHQQVIPAPTPGDHLLQEGRSVLPAAAQRKSAPPTATDDGGAQTPRITRPPGPS